jgi:toxin YoeB
MAKRVVVWTITASKQRREILKYWTEKNGSTLYAAKLIKIIKVRIQSISRNPDAFKPTSLHDFRVS